MAHDILRTVCLYNGIRMADVQFTDEQALVRTTQATKLPPLVGLVVRMGFAKDRRSAEYVLIGVALLALITTIGIWFFSGSNIDEDVPGPLEQRAAPIR